MTAKNLYAYTLQPVNYEISEAEQRQAQLAIWRSTNKISTKSWIIMAVVAVLSIVGIILLKNYSTIFCWVALVGVVAYFLIRKFVQPHGLIMRQKMGAQEGVGAIGWKDIYEWYNTPDFLLINFKVKGQQGAYILPKRMDSRNFSFNTIRKHLTETVGEAKQV